MASTNLLQWNPTAANQESDAAYTADSQRAGGATEPSVFRAVLANKAYYQWSTFLTALFTAFANKGFTTSDASLSTLTAQCANFLTTADVRTGIRAVTYATSMTLDCSLADGFEVLLTGNVTALNIVNAVLGQSVTLVFVQDGVGGRTVAFPTNVKNPGTPSTVAGETSVQTFKILTDLNLHPTTPVMVS
jgi:hypothetical protein